MQLNNKGFYYYSQPIFMISVFDLSESGKDLAKVGGIDFFLFYLFLLKMMG